MQKPPHHPIPFQYRCDRPEQLAVKVIGILNTPNPCSLVWQVSLKWIVSPNCTCFNAALKYSAVHAAAGRKPVSSASSS